MMRPNISPTKRKHFKHPIPTMLLALAVMLCPTPSSLALSAGDTPTEPVRWEETLFLGEAVPMRQQGVPLAELLREEFPGQQGELEAWWVSPQGRAPLEELGRERPKEDETYRISTVLHREDGKDSWANLLYRVRVVSGAVRVRADGREAVPGASALFMLEGEGLTLYQQAIPEADPQGGPAMLEAQFTGLPYGVYTVTAVDGGQPAKTCRLGVCETDDTIDPARCGTTLRFTLDEDAGQAVGESYRLRFML